MKIEKQADGKYYVKIVTWEKEPNVSYILLSIICLIYTLLLFFVTMSTESLDEALNIPFFRVIIVISIGLALGGGFALFLFLLLFKGIGEGKKIKFKRINS